jgi:pimeloyl-ACP methyl ester carboxylesterase
MAAVAERLTGPQRAADNRALRPMHTLGGKQFWADELHFHDWRIQRNVFTEHCRLLDGRNRRHAWGDYGQCLAVLDEIKRDHRLPPMTGKAVVVLHGLGRCQASMASLCRYLREKGEYQVFNVEYPSTRNDMGRHAQALRHIIDNLHGIEEINFVGHSMGNIVIRQYLGDVASHASRRFGRFVMLAPPNQGAALAEAFAENLIFRKIAGDAGQQLGCGWRDLERRLATPNFEFGIIAGGRGNKRGFNPLLSGDNDGVISVETAKLAGARDFLRVPVLHSFMMVSAKVQQYVLRFLQQGYFISAEKRHPLTRPETSS